MNFRKKYLFLRGPVLAWSFFLFQITGLGAAGNLAAGKPYTFNALPTKKWEKLLPGVPDYWKVLTDGETESSASFWTSAKCVNFYGVRQLEVVIDLGETKFIGEILAAHGARPASGITLPRREAYFVSDDGALFKPVGVFENTADPAGVTDENVAKTTFFAGRKIFTSGPIHTRGRYVMVRTTPSAVETDLARTIGFDEIQVTEANTAEAGHLVTRAPAIHPQGLAVPEEVMGWRLAPPDWNDIGKNHPLHFFLAPMGFLGDDAYYLSTGGIYVLTFSPVSSGAGTPSNTVLTVELPTSVRVINSSGLYPLDRGESSPGYATYTFRLGAELFKGYMQHPYLVVTSSKGPGLAGRGVMKWAYTVGGRKYNHDSSFRVEVMGALSAPTPSRFQTGFWWPYQSRFLSNDVGIGTQIFSFYRRLGFTHQLGQRQSGFFKSAEETGLTVWVGSALDNGVMVPGASIPDGDRFLFHPSATSRKKIVAYCPTALLTEEAPRALLVARIAQVLGESHHVYGNWEPYMFLKQGCICPRCRKAFQDFSRATEDEMALWPDLVTNMASAAHNRFSSHQYGSLVTLMQTMSRSAGAALGRNKPADFLMALEPRYLQGDHPWHLTHDPGVFKTRLNEWILWLYPNTVCLTGLNQESLVGNTLSTLGPAFAPLKEPRPKTFFMGTEYFDLEAVLPRDLYFMTLFAFFDGMEGYGSWTYHFKSDARLLALQAKAHHLIKYFEDAVMGGKKIDIARALPLSPVPHFEKKPTLVAARAFQVGPRILVAVGNDFPLPMNTQLRLGPLPPNVGDLRLYDTQAMRVYQKKGGQGFSPDELAQGIALRIPGKDWAVLWVSTEAPGGGFTPVTPEDMAARRPAEDQDFNEKSKALFGFE